MSSTPHNNGSHTSRKTPSMLPPVNGRGKVTLPGGAVRARRIAGAHWLPADRDWRHRQGVGRWPRRRSRDSLDEDGCRLVDDGEQQYSRGPRVLRAAGRKPTSTVTPVAAALKVETQPQRLPGGFRMPRAVLVDQNGKSVNLYDDLVRGRVVVMKFIFTTCRGICPHLGRRRASDALTRSSLETHRDEMCP